MLLFRRHRTITLADRRRQVRPRLEVLEERAVPAGNTFYVTLAGDSGVGSGTSGDFRYCLTQANSATGQDSIVFSIGGTVSLNSALPAITSAINIVGLGPQATGLQRASGAAAFRILAINYQGTVNLSGLALCGGSDLLGGGILNQGTLAISNCQIDNNAATGGSTGGGGILNQGALAISNCQIDNNAATGGRVGGGGIDNQGTLAISNCQITNNVATLGGGIDNEGTLAVIGCPIENNVATGGNTGGGGIDNEGGSLSLQQSLLIGNRATASDSVGGGLFNHYGGATVGQVTFQNNTAAFGGAALLETAETSTSFTNCTFGGNVATSDGGALYVLANVGSNVVGLDSCTIADNQAPGLGGARVFARNGASGTLTFRDSLFASNQNGNLGAFVADGSSSAVLQSQGHNLSDDSHGFDSSLGDLTNTNPVIGPLADNGDPLAPTFALLPGSPAIAAADPSSPVNQDERGVSRPQGNAPDIGAFELRPVSYGVSGDDQSTQVGQAFGRPVSVQVLEGGQPLVGVPVTFTIQPSNASGSFAGAPQVTVITDSNGVAVAPPLMAGTTAGIDGSSFSVLARAGADPNPVSLLFFVYTGPVSQYALLGPSEVVPGQAFSLTVTPEDSFGNPTRSNLGTVSFTSSDPRAVLPPPYTFPSGESSALPAVEGPPGSFAIPGFTLNTSGSQTITLTEQNANPHSASTTVAVADEPPQNLVLTLPDGSKVKEGQSFDLQAHFDNPGGAELTHQVTIDWGDGSTDTFGLAAGVTSFDLPHVYTRGLPVGLSVSVPINVKVSDDAGSTSAATSVTVLDVPPIVQPGPDDFATVGIQFTHTIGLVDPGTDPLTVTIDYGDGIRQTFQAPAGSFSLAHTYQDDASFFVTITADDGPGNRDTEQFRVDVLLPGVQTKQRDETVSPGQMGTVSVPGASATLFRAPDSQGNAVLILAVVPPFVADSLDRSSTASDTRTAGAYDLRALNIGSGDVALIRLSYSNDDTRQPTLMYFNKATGREEAVPTSEYRADPVAHVILLRLDRFSTPRLQDLGGTVFTISVPVDLGPTTGAFTTAVPSALPDANAVTVAALVSTGTQGGTFVLSNGQGQASSQGLQLAATTTGTTRLGSNGGGPDSSTGSGPVSEAGPLRELPPAPAALITLPTVTVSPARVELPSYSGSGAANPSGPASDKDPSPPPDEPRNSPAPPRPATGQAPPSESPPAVGTLPQAPGRDTVFERLGEKVGDRAALSVDLVLSAFALRDVTRERRRQKTQGK